MSVQELATPIGAGTPRRYTAEGLRVLSLGEPKPALLFGGVPVSFHRVDGVGLVNFIHGAPRPPNV